MPLFVHLPCCLKGGTIEGDGESGRGRGHGTVVKGRKEVGTPTEQGAGYAIGVTPPDSAPPEGNRRWRWWPPSGSATGKG